MNDERTCELFTREAMTTERIPLGNVSGRAPIPPTKQVLYAFLYSMANQEPTRAVAARFDITLSSVDWALKSIKSGSWSIRSIHPMAQWWVSVTKHNNQRTNLPSRWSGSHVDDVDSGLGETGPEQQWSNGTEVIPIFRNIGLAEKVVLNFRKFFPELFPFHCISDRKSRKFWLNGKRPRCPCRIFRLIIRRDPTVDWSNHFNYFPAWHKKKTVILIRLNCLMFYFHYRVSNSELCIAVRDDIKFKIILLCFSELNTRPLLNSTVNTKYIFRYRQSQ